MSLPPLGQLSPTPAAGGPADTANLTPQQRVERINSLRQRLINGDTLSDDEIRMGVRLLSAERQHNVDNAGRKKTAAPKEDNAARAKAKSLFAGLSKS